jgi:hypothetical protein
MSPDELRKSLYRGIRLAQNVCYCRDWSKFQVNDAKPDPFGRPAKVLADYSPEPVVVEPVDPAPAPSSPMFTLEGQPYVVNNTYATPVTWESWTQEYLSESDTTI